MGVGLFSFAAKTPVRMPRITRQSVFLFGCAMLLVSQIFSPFLLSLSMWVICYSCLVSTGGSGWPTLNLPFLFGNFFKKPQFWSISLLFWVAVASGLWSENQDYWLTRAQVRLPFFILPLAFANAPEISRIQFNALCALFLTAIAATGLGVLVNFALHYEEVMNLVSHGKAVPVPRNHIRFSLLVALGIAVGWQLFRRRFFFKKARERWIWFSLAGFLFVLLHVLAVRSGLAAGYAVVAATVAGLVFSKKHWRIGLTAAAALSLSAVVLFKNSPALRTKIGYMIWDNTRGNEFPGTGYSDTDRLLSLQKGWKLFLEKPFLGSGMGDLPADIARIEPALAFKSVEEVKLPHNQFVYILASTGLLGLLTALMAWTMPFFYQNRPREPLFTAAMTVLFVSFLVEYTIEGTFGAVFAAFFPVFFNMKTRDD